MAHLTGGGFYDNIPRTLPADCRAIVERRAWEPLPIFKLIQQLGNVPDSEMYRTFNMGIGYILVVPREQAGGIVEQLNAGGTPAAVIGEIARGGHDVQLI
jgi:phosphoribosylformylglycinamidine cyclo-ligase